MICRLLGFGVVVGYWRFGGLRCVIDVVCVSLVTRVYSVNSVDLCFSFCLFLYV